MLAARERVAWAAGGASAGDAAHAAAGLPPDAAETDPGAAGTAQADAWADSSAGALERAAELLAGAARPAIVAGTGVARARAAAALCTLAERLQAPVATSVAAKGVFSNRHPLCLGAAHPPYRPLTEYLRSRDVVLLAGTGWPAAALAEGTRTRTVRIDVEPRADAEVTIQADAGWALAQLAARLDRGAAGGPAAAPAVAAEVARLRAQREAPSEQLQPQRSLSEALRAALPEDGILVHDMTQLGYYSRGYFPVYQPDSYQIPRGNLGAALPLALGAKLACPRRAVVALCGDGGLLYHVQELAHRRSVRDQRRRGGVQRQRVRQRAARPAGRVRRPRGRHPPAQSRLSGPRRGVRHQRAACSGRRRPAPHAGSRPGSGRSRLDRGTARATTAALLSAVRSGCRIERAV